MSQHVDTADEIDPIAESSMTLMEHLIELRTRMMWVGAAVIIATLIAMIFAWDIVEIINRPLGGYIPQAIGPTDNLVVFFKVALASGAAAAMPVIMYQLIAFIAPGLYPHERRALLLILPGAMILFVTGVVFAFFVMIPPAVRFLQGFGGDNIRTEWTASLYISFITRITFWIGVAFQAPLVIGFFARIGLISGPNLLRFWRQAIVITSIAAAFITPTIDPVNMTIVMGPLIILYFFSVGVAYIMYRPREPRDFSEGFIPKEYGDDDDDNPPSGNPPSNKPPSGGGKPSSGSSGQTATVASATEVEDAVVEDTVTDGTSSDVADLHESASETDGSEATESEATQSEAIEVVETEVHDRGALDDEAAPDASEDVEKVTDSATVADDVESDQAIAAAEEEIPESVGVSEDSTTEPSELEDSDVHAPEIDEQTTAAVDTEQPVELVSDEVSDEPPEEEDSNDAESPNRKKDNS